MFPKPLENEHQIKNYLNLANKKPWISRRSGRVGDRVARFFTHNLNAKKTLKFSITSYDLVLSLSNSKPQPDESPTSELYLSRKTAFKDRWIFRYRYRKVLAQCVEYQKSTALFPTLYFQNMFILEREASILFCYPELTNKTFFAIGRR